MNKNAFMNVRIFMGSVTNISTRPFRRLVFDLGAEAALSEMAIARNIEAGRRQDMAILRRAPGEKVFGAQIVGKSESALVKAAKYAEEMGADFVDFNCACPHQSVISRGAGAALLERPEKTFNLMTALRSAVNIPISIKIRKGFGADDCVTEQFAQLAQKAGFNAIFIHGRTKAQQYRGDADWESVENAARNCDIPVIGCGDLAHGSQIVEKMHVSACAGFALARGALMKPWIFQEIQSGHTLDPSPEERLSMLAKLIRYTLDDFGEDEKGLRRSRDFLMHQMGFLVRYIPVGAIGRELPMQERIGEWTPRSDLEAKWALQDSASMLELLHMAGLPETPDPTKIPPRAAAAHEQGSSAFSQS